MSIEIKENGVVSIGVPHYLQNGIWTKAAEMYIKQDDTVLLIHKQTEEGPPTEGE